MKKVKKEIEREIPEATIDNVVSEIETLRKLYEELKNRGINSIGDLENQIARLQR